MIITDLERTTTTFATTLIDLTEQMTTLANQVNNANNNRNQRKDKGGEHIRVLRGGNNHVGIVENSSSEEKPYEKEVVVHDYRVKADISLFYGTMGLEEFWIGKYMLICSSTLWTSLRTSKLIWWQSI